MFLFMLHTCRITLPPFSICYRKKTLTHFSRPTYCTKKNQHYSIITHQPTHCSERLSTRDYEGGPLFFFFTPSQQTLVPFYPASGTDSSIPTIEHQSQATQAAQVSGTPYSSVGSGGVHSSSSAFQAGATEAGLLAGGRGRGVEGGSPSFHGETPRPSPPSVVELIRVLSVEVGGREP